MKSLSLQQYLHLVDQHTGLTESEKELNNYFVTHFAELGFHGIIDVSKNANVSKATVGRFLNKIGFTGYAEFKRVLSEGLYDKHPRAPIDAYSSNYTEKREAVPQLSERFMSNARQMMQALEASLSLSEVEAFIELLADTTRTIYVIGPSSSEAMAKHFSTLGQYLRSDIQLLNIDTGELPKTMMKIKSDDVLVVFSYYRFNRVVVDVAKWFKKKSGQVVTVTNADINPYGRFSDLRFILPSDVGSIFQSRLCGFYFVELILTLLGERLPAEDQNYTQIEDLFKHFDTFAN